jgi:hypothetical protein
MVCCKLPPHEKTTLTSFQNPPGKGSPPTAALFTGPHTFPCTCTSAKDVTSAPTPLTFAPYTALRMRRAPRADEGATQVDEPDEAPAGNGHSLHCAEPAVALTDPQGQK